MGPDYPPITLRHFQDLWIHTGTACNLSCPFCHEGSKPGDERLQAVTPAQVAPLLEAAAAGGVRRFIFTGGEPLILKGIHELLLRALQWRPVLVLTNGTAPFIRRSHQLAALRAAAHALSFRVSIDSPVETEHDAGRGLKNFRKAMEGLRLLHHAGFEVGITRQMRAGEDAALVEQKFRQLLRRHDLPQALSIVALPQLGALDAAGGPPQDAFAAAPHAPAEPLCARGRMLIRRGGSLRLTACPLVDDEPAFDRDPGVELQAPAPIVPLHRRCALCRSADVNYIGAASLTGV